MDFAFVSATEDWDRRCVVCEKFVGDSGYIARLNVDGEMYSLCCPLCMQAFEKETHKYVVRRLARKGAQPHTKPET